MHASSPLDDIAAAAAVLVADEGLDYASAKRKALKRLGASPRTALPSDEQVEDALREHLAVFHAETQPRELRALREVALAWMRRLAEFRPHVAGAVWRGTATAASAVRLDLYCDDPKAAEIALINAGVDCDSGALDAAGGREPTPVLMFAVPGAARGERVTLHAVLHDADALRGALKPDARGLTWRGDADALQRLLAEPRADAG